MAQDPATARAQAADMLDEVAASLKRQMRASKEALQAVRQAQAAITGITVQTITQPHEEQSVTNADRQAEALKQRVIAELRAS